MNEESLFAAALEKATIAERQAFLDETCGDNSRLRQRLEKLIAADAHARGILERGPDPAALLAICRPESLLAPEQLFADRFRLCQKVGEGGMGEVWVADQIEPVQRRVALKVIRPGLDSARLLARFDLERRTLALMDHTNIARVLDAGVGNGRPFFVMDLIHGVPITKYCDDAKLSPRQRLELFIPVCHAVQHAHQKGIIHRDIKPTNILVTMVDGNPVPKVIDFGIAKATGPQPCGSSVSTEIGTLVGTLEYMSPEQADLNGLDIDTRSDIYSLGIVLYELLTGSVPFSRVELQAVPFTEMLRIIKDVEPAKPSTRLAETASPLEVASARHTEPKKLTALVRGELDWIVMKALEKDRERRYETANGLAADLRRYLADEPVLAGPPSARYRMRKFLRRNRGPVLAASLVLLALVGGIVGTTIGLVRAEQARQAEAQRTEGERLAKETAEKRLVQIEKGIDVLGSIFENLDPRADEKDDRPLRAILGDQLDAAAAALEGDAIGDPLVVAKLQDRLGRTYLGLGLADRAELLFAKSLATHQTHLGAQHALTLASTHHLALAYLDAGKRPEAIALLEGVRDVHVKELGADNLVTLATMNDLARAYHLVGKRAEAVELLEHVRTQRQKQLGADNPDTLVTLTNLARAYLADQKRAEAIELFTQVRDTQVKKFGEDDLRALEALNNLAFGYQAIGKMTAAIDLLEKARDTIVLKLGPDHPRTLTVMHNLAWMYRAVGRLPEAIDLAEQVRAKRVLHSGVYHPATLAALDNLAMAYRDDGKLERALPLFQQAAAGMEWRKFQHVEAGRIIRNLCGCCEQLERFDEAEAWRRKWVAAVKVKDGPESAACIKGLTDLGASLLRRQKYAEAEPVLRECLDILQKRQPGAFATGNMQSLLGASLFGQRKYAEAEPLLMQGYEGMKKCTPELVHQHYGALNRQALAEALERLALLYDAWGKSGESARWRKKLEAGEPGTAAPPKE